MGEQQWGDRVYRRARSGRRWAAAVAVAMTATTVGVVLDPPAALAATFTVTSNADSGPGTLRQAILDANANPGDDTITFALPGAGVRRIDLAGTDLPPVTGVTTIDGYSQPGSSANSLAVGSNAVRLVQLIGVGAPSSVGIDLRASGSVLRGLSIGGFGTGVKAGPGTSVVGNYLGQDPSGLTTAPNEVGIQADSDVVIGTSAPADRNVISLNAAVGVFIPPAASGVKVQGNYIGTDASGTSAAATAFISGNPVGIQVGTGVAGGPAVPAVIGGTAAEGNVISGNVEGVKLLVGANDNTVSGNLIGVNAAGTAAVGNSYGVVVNSTGNLIGGDYGLRGNVVSGNGFGMVINRNDNVVRGNIIGLGADGLTPVPNQEAITVGDAVSTDHTRIGGPNASTDRNVISGNLGEAIALWGNAEESTIQNNYIGVAADGVTPRGNDVSTIQAGGPYGAIVLRNFTHDNVITTNTIAYNTGAGVIMFSGNQNRVTRNSIYANTTLPVSFGPTTLVPNDAGDPDGDPNRKQNHPVLQSARVDGGNLRVDFSLDSLPGNTTYPVTVEFHQVGPTLDRFVTSTIITGPIPTTPFTLGSALTLGVSSGDLLSATATDANGNTSQYSPSVAVITPVFTVTTTGDAADAAVGNGVCATATGDCTLRAALAEANAAGDATVKFAIAGAGPQVITAGSPLPTVTRAVKVDGLSQPGSSCAAWPPTLNVVVTGGGSTGPLFKADAVTSQLHLDGLVVNGYAGYGVVARNGRYTCNLFGADPNGSTHASTATGAAIQALSGNIVGGGTPRERNLFVGNETSHIEITEGANGIYGNFIGTTPNGQAPQGTGVLAGVRLVGGANGNNIGTSVPSAPGNRISGAERGVSVESTVAPNAIGNQIRQNSIFGTTVQGIDLGGDGVTLNHRVDPQDPTPIGPNHYQNFPLLTIATSDTSDLFANTRLAGELAGVPGRTYEIDLFRSPSCNASSFGNGDNHIQTVTATADPAGVVRFDTELAEFATTETWGATATATDLTTQDTSEFSYCRPVSTPNITWGTAQPIELAGTPKQGSATQYLTDVLQEKWFRIPVLPDANVRITLTSQPGSAVSLHTDPTPIFNQLQNPASAAVLSAEAADTGFLPSGFLPSGFLPSGFLPSGFLPSGFLPSGFLPSGFLPSGFLPSGFLPSGFLPSGFLPSGFLPSGFLPSASLPSGFLPSGFLPSGFLPSGFLPSGFLPAGSEGAYDMAARRSLLGVSNDPTATVQTIERNTYDYDGDLYVRVVGPYSLTNTFKLDVTVIGGVCERVANVPADLSVVTGAVSAVGKNTLIVTDSARLPGTSAEVATALASLGTLAARPDVNGVVIDLNDPVRYPRVAFANAQADANQTCAAAKNRVADEIKKVLDVYRNPTAGGSSAVQYVVLAGGASVIPFHQVTDVAGLAPEKEYIAPVAPNTPSDAGLRSNLVKGQDFYGSSIRLNVGGRLLDVPDQAVGRLVETASDISAAVTTYINTNGVVTPRSSLTTGYDFVGDGAAEIAKQFSDGLGTPSDTTLIQPPGEPPTGPKAWTADQLRSKLFGPSYDIVTMTGHFSAGDLVAADYTTTMAASEVLQTTADLTNTIVLALGCHSGFTIPNGDLLAGASPNPDWAKAFLRKGAVTFVAATGYAYGDTEFAEYGERLFIELAKQMRTGPGPIPMGAALVAAKRAYMAATPQLTGIDEKTIVEMTLYGLPMVKVDVPGLRLPGTGAPGTGAAAPTAVPGNDLGLNRTSATISTPVNGPFPKNLTDVSTNTPVETTYFTGADGVVANPYEPVQPKQINDATVTGQVLRGVAFRGGTYTDLDGKVPLTSAPATETSVAHTSYNSPTFYPAQIVNPNLFDAVDGGATRLVTVPGQFRSSAPGAVDGTLRTFGNVDVQLYYLPSSWTTAGSAALKSAAVSPAPEVVGATATVAGSVVTFKVTAQNAGNASVQSVWIVYTGERGSSLYGRWRPLDLVRSADDPTTWTGTLDLLGDSPGSLRFMVGAVNTAGLTSMNTAQGAYFSVAPTTPPPPPAATAITLVIAPTTVTYTTPVTLSAKLTSGASALSGQLVVFDIGGQQVLATTGTDGTATATFKPFVVPGAYTLQASFRGASGFTASSVAAPVTVAKMATTLTLTSVDRSTVRVRLVDTANVPLAGQSVVFVVSSTGPTPTIVAARAVRTDGSGVALFGDLALANGSYTVDAYFNGTIPLPGGTVLDARDDFYESSRSGASVTIAPPDRTAPTISVAATSAGQPYLAGAWAKGDVLVTFSCADEAGGSGIATCGPNVTVTAEGTTPSVTGTAVDGAGNSTPTTFGPIRIDRTAPTVTITTPVNGATYALGAVVTASFSCADNAGGSGLASCLGTVANGGRVDTTTAGPKTFTVTATDVAGNVTTRSVTYTVAAANQAPVVKADMGVAGLETIGFQTLAVALTGSFTDADGPGPYTASVRWQAGGAFTPLILNNSSQFVAAFIYSSAGTRVATVRICDAQNNCGTDDVTIVAATTLKITPVRQCVLDRGAGRNPRYAARFGYNNPAPYAIAVPILPSLENFVSPNPALRGQPVVFLTGTQRNVFDADFNTGTVSWKLNGVTVSATTTTTPRC